MCFNFKNNHGKAKRRTPITIFLDKFNNLFTKGANKYEGMLNKTVKKKTSLYLYY
jgi:hypothetical protein